MNHYYHTIMLSEGNLIQRVYTTCESINIKFYIRQTNLFWENIRKLVALGEGGSEQTEWVGEGRNFWSF